MPLSTWTNTQVIGQMNSLKLWTSATITYAFPTTTTGLTSSFGEANTFSAFNTNQVAMATVAIGLWDDIIAPDMLLTTAATSDIDFANSFEGTYTDYASAYFPTFGTVWLNNAFDGSGLSSPKNSVNNNLVNPVIGRHGFSTLLHELGHALGLEHPGDTLTPSNYRDSTVYSVMSYFGPSWGSGGEPTLVAWADWVGNDGVLYEPQTMMIDDILVMQSMYGAETTTRTGNTTYGFNSTLSNSAGGIYDFTLNLNPILCLYDSGGIDTLDLSGWNTQCLIDLTAGAFSSANSMTNNISIAYGVTIENAAAGGGDDTLTGNSAANILNGGAGADTLNGGLGDDTLIGGTGADALIGGGGNDTASYLNSVLGVNIDLTTGLASGGDAQGDTFVGISNLIGSIYNDTLTGTAGINTLIGGGGNDRLNGGVGADILNGDGGIDYAEYYYSSTGVTVNLKTNVNTGGDAQGDVLFNIEVIHGSNFVDNITGDDGNNTLYGNNGNDTLNGGLGNDTVDGGIGADTLDGGQGYDLAEYYYETSGVTVNLATGSSSQGDTLLNFEAIEGSNIGDDNLTGDNNANTLYGAGGNDVLNGGAGNDTLVGGYGDDILVGGVGADVLISGGGVDTASYAGSAAGVTVSLAISTQQISAGDASNDTLLGISNLIGSSFADTLTGDAYANTLIGGTGADALIGGGGNDTFIFKTGFGLDYIGDFSAGNGIGDLLDISSFVWLTNLDQIITLSMQVSGDTVIQITANDSITLHNVLIANLVSNDFIFALV
jgi:serralysin